MAEPTFVASGDIASGTADVTVDPPASHLSGDVELLYVETGPASAPVLGTPHGFAVVPDSPGAAAVGDPNGCRLTVFWRRWDGIAGSPVITDPGNHAIGVVLAFRGCIDTGDPWDVTAGGIDEDGVDAPVAIPGDTTTVADCLVVAATGHGRDIATAHFTSITNSSLTSVTTRVNAGSIAGNGGGFGIATGVKAAAGVFDATMADPDAASIFYSMHTIALKPAAGGGISEPMGTVAEADTPQVLGRRKTRPLPVTTGVETAQSLGRRKVRALATVVETDQVVPVGTAPDTLPVVVETDTPQVLGRRKVRPLPTVVEAAAAAQTVGRRKARTLHVATEGSTAVPPSRRKARTLPAVLEAALALLTGRIKRRTIPTVTETDEAVPLVTPGGPATYHPTRTSVSLTPVAGAATLQQSGGAASLVAVAGGAGLDPVDGQASLTPVTGSASLA